MNRVYIYIVFFSGAQVDIKDNFGRNFLHLTVQQPYGLKNLQPEFMQVMYIYEFPLTELGSTENKLILFIVIFVVIETDYGILKMF